MSGWVISALPLAIVLGVLVAEAQDRWRRWKLSRTAAARAWKSWSVTQVEFYHGGLDPTPPAT